MEGKGIVTFDTNFIIENKAVLRDTIKSIKEKYECIIFDLVIEEIKGQKIRDTLMEYNNIMEKIKQSKEKNKWLKIEDKTNIKLEQEKQENDLETWMNNMFGENIIKFDNTVFMKDLLRRAKYKTPPFNNSEKSSDKGFKDTLIFLNIKKYSTETKNDLFFITNDKGFINNKNELEKEFLEETNNNLSIISGSKEEILQALGIIEIESETQRNDKDNTIFPASEQSFDLDTFRDELLSILNRMFFFQDYILYEKMDISNIEYFINSIEENVNTYIFCKEVNGKELLNISCKDFYFSLSDLRALLQKYELIKGDNRLKEAFFFALLEEFNKLYCDLPF